MRSSGRAGKSGADGLVGLDHRRRRRGGALRAGHGRRSWFSPCGGYSRPGCVNWAGPRRDDPFSARLSRRSEDRPRARFRDGGGADGTGTCRGLAGAGSGGPLWAIYVHGVGGLRENGLRQLSVLHEAGIPTLMIGYRNDPWGPKGEPSFYSFRAARVARPRGGGDLGATAAARSGSARRGVMGAGIAGQFLMRSEEAGRVRLSSITGARLRPSSRALPDGRRSEAIVPLGLDRAGVLPVDLGQRRCRRGSQLSGAGVRRAGTRDPLVPVGISRDSFARGKARRSTSRRTRASQSWQADRERYRSDCWACSGA